MKACRKGQPPSTTEEIPNSDSKEQIEMSFPYYMTNKTQAINESL